ncbi:10266_t:CDS:2, partial [Paraglomus occultum]
DRLGKTVTERGRAKKGVLIPKKFLKKEVAVEVVKQKEPEDADFALYIENQGYTVDDVERKEGRLDKLRDKYDGNKEDISDSSSNEDEVETIENKTKRIISLPERD